MTRFRTVLPTAALVVGALAATAGGTALLVRSAHEGQVRTPRPSAVGVGFAQDMAVHHQRGVLMSEVAAGRSTDPAVLALAREVVVGASEQRGCSPAGSRSGTRRACRPPRR